MTGPLPTLSAAKAEARALRAEHAAKGTPLPHSRALEVVARSYGFRDWNTCHAAIVAAHAKGAWQVGAKVSGRYLSQPFTATIRAVQEVQPGQTRLELDLDEAVDVVRFESFSNFRKRIRATVGRDGRTADITSDGMPHLVLDRAPPAR